MMAELGWGRTREVGAGAVFLETLAARALTEEMAGTLKSGKHVRASDKEKRG